VPIWLGKASKEVEVPKAGMLLSDFGESFMLSFISRLYSNTLLSFRPPEARFLPIPLGFPADIWSLVYLIWEVLR
jgi:hypothetical protein